MDRTACTEPQCLYKGAFYLFFTSSELHFLRCSTFKLRKPILLATTYYKSTLEISITRLSVSLRNPIYEGNSISKLQIVIEKNRMEIMTYK